MSEASEAVAARIARVEAALAILDRQTLEPPPRSDEAPIFIASIGWRTGSTLLQRILMTDPSVMIWGEPLDRMLIVSQFTDAIATVDATWPRADAWIASRGEADLTREWVAMLSPDPGRLKAGMRAMLDAWLAEPAKARGRPRWGAKEIRWSGADGLVLRWLYPGARFLVLARHPAWSYYSMRNFGPVPLGAGLSHRWPERVVPYETAYGRLWNELGLSWLAVADRLGARLIRYEDLIDGRIDIAAMGAELGLALDPQPALDAKVGGSAYGLMITEDEKDGVNAATAEARAGFQYSE
jgi:hypothetical protein